MTQFKKKVSFHSNSSTIYSHNEFFNAIQFPPKCHHWDDFFDFSRMSIPSDGHVFCRRLSRGSSRFFGNYIWIWNFLMIVCAITFNRRFLLPPVILSSVWIVICISTVIDGGFREKSSSTKQQYIIPLNERILLLFAISHLFLFLFGVLKQTYVVLLSSLALAVFHSGSRSILMEKVKAKAKVVSSDGFIDEIEEGEEEITMVFTKSDDVDVNVPGSTRSTLTNRKKQNTNGSQSTRECEKYGVDVLTIPTALKK